MMVRSTTVRRSLLSLLLLAGCVAAQDAPVATATPSESARDIVMRSLEHAKRNLDVRRNYVYQRREVEKELEKDGQVKKTEIRTYDVVMIFDRPYGKLIARNDQPLTPQEQQKEDEKMQKAFERRKKRAAERAGKPEEPSEDDRKLLQALPKAYDFRFAGEETIDGQPPWIIEAIPNPQFKPSGLMEKLLAKLRGRMWIDQKDLQWVKVDAEVIDDWSFGLFVAKLYKGTHLETEAARINDEIWLPKREYVNAGARVGWKTERVESETIYSNYQKFHATAVVTGVVGPPESRKP